MRAKTLSATLAKTIAAKLPVLIKGAPGIGKTDIVMAAADEAGANVILMHPVVSDPTDFKGLPAVVTGKAEFLPFGELEKLMTAKVLTVCFLDDLGQSPAAVQAATMQLILARQINGHKISDHVVFVAATNRREDKAGVSAILEPVKSRFTTILELEPNINDWTAWAVDNKLPPEVVAFVRFRPELMLSPGAATNDIINRPSPRTVANLAKLYALGFDDVETLGGAVGGGMAAEFVGFLRVFRQLPSLEGILENPDRADVPKEPAALWAIATALAAQANKGNANNVMRYMVRLPDEYAVLGIRDTVRKYRKAAECKEYINWAVKNQGLLSAAG